MTTAFPAYRQLILWFLTILNIFFYFLAIGTIFTDAHVCKDQCRNEAVTMGKFIVQSSTSAVKFYFIFIFLFASCSISCWVMKIIDNFFDMLYFFYKKKAIKMKIPFRWWKMKLFKKTKLWIKLTWVVNKSELEILRIKWHWGFFPEELCVLKIRASLISVIFWIENEFCVIVGRF